MRVSEVARRTGIAPSAVRFYEEAGVLPRVARAGNGYREYDETDLARLRLVVALRRLGLGPADAGRIAGVCLERGAIDADLAPVIAEQRASISLRRSELDRLEGELGDLESTIAAASRGAREPAVSTDPIRVLFVCTGNSARSQIGEAMLRDLGGPEFEAFSAGTEPKSVNPFTVRALADVGIDWSGARSKSVSEFMGRPFDYVITVCDRARQTCPVFPGEHNTLHWGLEDPADADGTDEQKLEAFRRTRTEIAMRLRPFIELARRARRESAPAR
jgi:arsenate reductase (thioredoxin)